MARRAASAATATAARSIEQARLAHADRREALLDAAAALVASGDVEAVSMEAVAQHAAVSRPLVYKHFANRSELLAAVYQREAAHLHRELAAAVAAAQTLEEMFRTLVHGSLEAQAERGPVFAALRASGAWSSELRHQQRRRDQRTVRAFVAKAVDEFGV